jgi:beta-glucanase (GH16 family)
MSPRVLSAAVTLISVALGATACTSSTQGEGGERAVLTMHPQLAQPGREPASASRAQSVMTATLKPARQGRAVFLQQRRGGKWDTVEQSRQNKRGTAEFTAPYASDGQPAVYRIHAKGSGGLDSVTSKAVATSQPGRADFTDEFSGTQLGSDWKDRLQGYSAVSKRRCAKADPRAAEVAGGVLRLSVMTDPDRVASRCRIDGNSYAWRLNGHVGTEGARSFTYGYAAARIKFQQRRGQHGSFWLQPATRQAEEGSAKETGAEIDVIEWFGEGDPQGGLASFIHHNPDDGKPGVTGEKVGGYLQKPKRFGADWASRFHVFSVEWTPSEYIFRIDGQETFRTAQGVSGQPQYLILSLLSSDYELPWLGGEDRLPQHMEVDWVQYWERRN